MIRNPQVSVGTPRDDWFQKCLMWRFGRSYQYGRFHLALGQGMHPIGIGAKHQQHREHGSRRPCRLVHHAGGP